MNEVDGECVVIIVIEVAAVDAAEPVQPVRVAGPDERTVIDIAETFDAAHQAFVRRLAATAEAAQTAR